MKKDVSIMLSLLAIILSLTTIILFFVRVSSLSVVDSNTFIGVCTSVISISVTLIIGYQIVNTLQIRKELVEAKQKALDLEKLFQQIQEANKLNEYQMQEGFEYISAIIKYNNNGETSSAIAFKEYHHALLSSIHSNRTDYEWIFDSMRTFLAQMNISNFANDYTTSGTGKLISKEIIQKLETYQNEIEQDEKLLREADKFPMINIEYNRVMKIFRERLNQILYTPEHSYLSPEEQKKLIQPM